MYSDISTVSALIVSNASITNSWKGELREKLEKLALTYSFYTEAVHEIRKWTPAEIEKVSFILAVDAAVNQWIESKCAWMESKSNNQSHLIIEKNKLPEIFRTFDARIFNKDKQIDSSTCSLPEFVEFTNKIVNGFNFGDLLKALATIDAKIQDIGFREAADSLGSSFRFTRDKLLSVKQQKGRLILDVAHYGTCFYDRIKSLKHFLLMAHSFENESGVSGLCDCLEGLILAEEDASAKNRWSDGRVDSRTKIETNPDVRAVFFKEVIKFHVKPNIFEALLGFVKHYGSRPVSEVEVIQ